MYACSISRISIRLLPNLTSDVYFFVHYLTIYRYQEQKDLDWAGYSMCVEEWPHPLLKPAVTIAILCIQYLLPVIVLPVVHALVSMYKR